MAEITETVALLEDDSFDIVINNKLEVHIRRNDDGYSFDFYRAAINPTDDHNWDDDFITAVCLEDSDIGE